MAASFVGMEELVGSCQRHVVSLSQSSFADTYLWIHGILIFWPHHLSSSSGLLSYGIAKKENQLCSWSFAGVWHDTVTVLQCGSCLSEATWSLTIIIGSIAHIVSSSLFFMQCNRPEWSLVSKNNSFSISVQFCPLADFCWISFSYNDSSNSFYSRSSSQQDFYWGIYKFHFASTNNHHTANPFQ